MTLTISQASFGTVTMATSTEATAPAAAAAATTTGTTQEDLTSISRYKLKPPFYNGDYGTFEKWKYKFTAYMGLMDPFYPNILRRAATSTQRLPEADLRGAAQNTEEADRWVQLDKVHACERDNRSCSNSV